MLTCIAQITYCETNMAPVNNSVELCMVTSLYVNIKSIYIKKKIKIYKIYIESGIIENKIMSNKQKYWKILFRGSVEKHRKISVSQATFKTAWT